MGSPDQLRPRTKPVPQRRVRGLPRIDPVGGGRGFRGFGGFRDGFGDGFGGFGGVRGQATQPPDSISSPLARSRANPQPNNPTASLACDAFT